MAHILKLKSFVKPYWKPAVLALILLIGVVIMDLAIPRLIQHIIDQGINQKNMRVVIQTTVIMLGLSAISALFAIGNNYISVRVGEGVARDLREALFTRIQSFSYGNLDKMSTGQLMVRLFSDASVFQRMVQVAIRIGTRAPLLMVGSLILMYITDPRLALIVLPILLVTGLVIVFFIRLMGPLYFTVQQKLDRLNTVLQENIAGVRVVKAFVRAEHEEERFAVVNQDYANRNIRVMQFMSTISPTLTMLVNIGVILVIWAGGIQSARGNLTVGQIVAFTNYLQTLLGPLTIMVMLSNVVAAAMASSERINEILDSIPEIQDDPNAVTLPALSQPRVAFENVAFHYNGAKDGDVLEGVNLVAEPGQTVAILGATGSGKSSLVNLIPRFYDVAKGRVTINGMDVRQVSQDSLLAQIGSVPQETILFSGTVRDNIRFGCPKASNEEVIEAAIAAQADEFIRQLPDGYDTHIEERGVNVSGGQKQRIAIARALLTHPAILILDDSTSSVDVETETKIHNALTKWMASRTSFMVAQRISTVLNADKIVVIDDGCIVAEGTHRELIQSSPIYQEIFASQLGNGIALDIKAELEPIEAAL